MITLFNRSRHFLEELSRRLNVKSSWLNGVKSIRSGMGYFNRVPLILIGKMRRSDSLAVFAFLTTILAIRRSQGNRGLAMWLKANQIILMNYLAGGKPHSRLGSPAVAVTGSGIPRVIPLNHRRILSDRRDGWDIVARLWMSLFGFYRVLPFKGKLNIKTITAPGVDFNVERFTPFMAPFVELMKFNKLSYNWVPLLILKSAPGTVQSHRKLLGLAYSIAVAPYHAFILVRSEKLWLAFSELSRILGVIWLPGLVTRVAMAWSLTVPNASDQSIPEDHSFLGKLGTKDEPGKVRVFAMVDWWTQVLLEPVHRWIIENLSKFPMDSTLDQDKGVERASFLVRLTHFGGSYDLSAATDRLPIVLQQILLDHFLPGFGAPWKELLVGRAYSLGPRKSVHYSVGQPMGALSSWAMLALTHHFLVQVSAWEAGVGRDTEGRYSLFTGYQVLGDDIVIFNRSVADKYLEIMSYLGVGISLAKSVVSKDSIEFAKRFQSRGRDLSPLAFKELDVSMASLDALALLLRKFRGDLPVILLARLRGAGYRTRSKLFSSYEKISRSMKYLLIWVTMPGISVHSFKSWMDWVGSVSFKRTDPSRISLQNLNERIDESVKGLGAREWDPGGATFYYKGETDGFKFFKNIHPSLRRVECSPFIDRLHSEIRRKAMNLKDEYDWFARTMQVSTEKSFESCMIRLLDLEQKVASARKGVDFSIRKDIDSPLFSGKWLRLWHRLRK